MDKVAKLLKRAGFESVEEVEKLRNYILIQIKIAANATSTLFKIYELQNGEKIFREGLPDFSIVDYKIRNIVEDKKTPCLMTVAFYHGVSEIFEIALYQYEWKEKKVIRKFLPEDLLWYYIRVVGQRRKSYLSP